MSEIWIGEISCSFKSHDKGRISNQVPFNTTSKTTYERLRQQETWKVKFELGFNCNIEIVVHASAGIDSDISMFQVDHSDQQESDTSRATFAGFSKHPQNIQKGRF